MPVDTSIICTVFDPGPQSKFIETSIWVSFVFRVIEACLAAMEEVDLRAWVDLGQNLTTLINRVK